MVDLLEKEIAPIDTTTFPFGNLFGRFVFDEDGLLSFFLFAIERGDVLLGPHDGVLTLQTRAQVRVGAEFLNDLRGAFTLHEDGFNDV